MKHRIIHSEGPYRIIEVPVFDMSYEDIEGDSFNPEVVTDICPEDLKRDQKKFRAQIDDEGVFGYALEYWNPEVDQGWTHIDSCFGFIGQYNEGALDYDHYIVDELKQMIKQKKVG